MAARSPQRREADRRRPIRVKLLAPRPWPLPPSSICACTANSRSPTARCASTTRSRRPRPMRMPALAITDLANAFGLVKFYQGGAQRTDVKPIVGCDVWLTHDAERDQPFRALLLRAVARRISAGSAEWLTRAYRTNQHRGRAEMRREWFDEGTDGLIALSGVARRRRGRGARCRAIAAGARKAAQRWSASFPGRYYLEVQRAGHADDDALRRRDGRARRASSRCRSWPRTRCSSCAARTFARTRRACASPRATCSPIRGGRARSPPTSISRRRPRWRSAFADLPGALANSRRDRAALQPHDPAGQELPARFSDAAGRHARRAPARRSGRRARAATRNRSIPIRPRATLKRAEYVARLEFETKTIVQMGFAGYFLIVADFINWAKRTACRSVRAAARARARSSPTRSASPTSIRCATVCCSSASSIPNACRCRTSTSTSARTAATASSTT